MLEHNKDHRVRCLLWPDAQSTYRATTPPTDSTSDSANSVQTVNGAPLRTSTGPPRRTRRHVDPFVHSRSPSPELQPEKASYMQVTTTLVNEQEPSNPFRNTPADSCCVAQEQLHASEPPTNVQQAHFAMSEKFPSIGAAALNKGHQYLCPVIRDCYFSVPRNTGDCLFGLPLLWGI